MSVLGLISPIAFIGLQLVMYLFFKRWSRCVESSIERGLQSTSSTKRGSTIEIVAVLKFSDRRKKAIGVFAFILIGFFFISELIAGLFTSDQPSNTYTERLLAESVFIGVCGLCPWILFVEPYGNIRAITSLGILKRSPWTGTAFVFWSEINAIRWIPFIDNFFVFSEKGMFSINLVYQDLDKFAEAVIKNVPRSRFSRAEYKLSLAAKGPFQP